VIYLDSSALLKLLREEPESQALDEWLSDRSEFPLISSELAKTEIVRACRRRRDPPIAAARTLLAALDLVPATGLVFELADEIGKPTLRTLDTIHLASALVIGNDLSAFVAYDQRLHEAAEAEGVPVESPGKQVVSR
jgi:uncharacterized protein